ncbi:MAG: methyltransferase domain-containing protein [Nostocaceae cyanobacterium]|nr:methyltransferase domain-containing protein [Nostocaceae cyanobacterium]
MSQVVSQARDYYNSTDADEFYAKVWGGEDIHIGLYENPQDSIFDASRRTVEKMASLLQPGASLKVLDIGSGYGGAARYIAKNFGCYVDCLNLSEAQNQRNREMTKSQGLDKQVRVFEGNFEDIPFGENSYDLVWSQDAIVHSGNRIKVVEEVYRVLKKDGRFLFTDIMQSDDCPKDVLQPIFDRICLDSMGSIGFYKQTAQDLGMEEVQIIELSQQLVNHYSQVLKDLSAKYEELVAFCTSDYLESQKRGLKQWIDAGEKGYITWGILQFKK